MFKLSRGRGRGGDLDPLESAWALTEGGTPDDPIFVRRNVGAEQLADSGAYPAYVLVQVPLHACDDRGMPEASEFPYLEAVEDALVAELTAGGAAVLVLVITRDRHRRFVVYTRDAAATSASADAVSRRFEQSHPGREFGVGRGDDPQWTVYRGFARA